MRTAGVTRSAVLLCALLAACGPKPKAKHPKQKKDKPDSAALAADAHAAAQSGDIDGAEAKFRAAMAAGGDITILTEEVNMLIDAKRIDVAVADSKEWYDAHP